MAELALSELVTRGLAREVLGDAGVRVRGIRHDSRRVEPGDLFVAIDGEQKHGSEYVPQALARGATAVLCATPLALSVPVVIADDVLRALAAIARVLYDDPGRGLTVTGITGTNGKTTSSYLIEALLVHAGRKPAVLGTVNFRGPGGVRDATHTTPMADDMMRLAQWARSSGATDLVLEVSSHGLHMHRADGLPYAVALFTNLTHDHLDYHGDFTSYANAKRRLFEELSPAHSVLNVDDAFGLELAKTAHGRVWRYSRRGDAQAEIKALQSTIDSRGIRARIATPQGERDLESPLVGEHNLENLLGAIGAGLALGLPLSGIFDALRTASGAPGRLERVADPERAVFVDYAHTPDALERVLRALRPITERRLALVFGCGGDRDRTKRPVMGQLAAELADVSIATSDNPRSEPPLAILNQIEAGLRAGGAPRLEHASLASAARGYTLCEDRRQAIGLGVAALARGDVLLIAGKGHETVQIVAGMRLPFDDREEARAALDRIAPRGAP